MQDHRIDLAARILKSVAGAGEALITDSALNCISDRSRILTLPPQRLRGVPETVSVSMIKHVLKSA
jgi:class 3 adenylate cyclase